VKKLIVPLFACVTFSVCLQAAQLPVTLGSSSTFTVLAGSTVTNTGFTTIVGNVGLSPGSAVTGFPPGTITGGALHVNDGAAVSAQADLSTAYIDAAGRNVAPVTVAGDLSGQTLPPGLYKSTSSLGIAGVLTLDGQGNANSVFIFQVASSLTTGTGSRVVLIGNANPANIFWQVGSSATLGTYSTFNGTILAYQSITLATGAILNGRALAEIGAVTLDSNPMANPGPPVTTPTPPAMTVTCPLGTAQVGVAYNSLLAATGGTPPYTFSITGSLPAGLSLVPATGLLIGTPTAAGASSFASNASDSASGTATNSCSINVAAAQANVSVAKSGPTTVAPNSNITYNLVVTNTGASLATNVTVTDVLPAGTTFVSATPSQGSCSGTSTVTCSLGTLAANGVATVVLVIRSPSTSGTVSNSATVSSTPNTGNNTSTWSLTVTAAPSLAVTCPLGAAQVGVGYSSSLVAAGGTPSYTYSITGSLPPGLSLLSPSTGAITGTPTGTGGAYSFTASVQDSASPTPGTATNSCSITVAAAQADVSINKSGPVPATVAANANITYSITVTNAGPSPAANVVVGDILPAGTTFVSATPSQGSCTGTSTVSCSLGTLAALGSATITLVVRSPSTSGTVANTATVASDTLDSNLANNTSTYTVTVTAAQADVSITKTGPTPATVAANANIAYTLTVTNAGPNPAANVTVTDVLPAGTTFVSATPSPAGSSCSGTSTVSCSLGTLAAGGSATIALVVKSPSSAGTVANTATVASSTLDSNLANNTSTASVTVTAAPASVPTLSTWGLALLALLLLLAGCSARFGRKARC
jgi:uncharacterized repeat protein (TIGR01451 family)